MNKIYPIDINASKEHIWKVLIGKYTEWSKGFSENPKIVGEWKQGSQIDFTEPGKGGTRATIELFDEPDHIILRHIAMLTEESIPDTDNDWKGTVEEYMLTQRNGMTKFTVHMQFHPDFEEMFDDGWDKSLRLLKELCER